MRHDLRKEKREGKLNIEHPPVADVQQSTVQKDQSTKELKAEAERSEL